MTDTPGPGERWEGHQGVDYTVVMAPGETTETASIRISSGDMERDDELACRIRDFLNKDAEMQDLHLGLADMCFERGQAKLREASEGFAGVGPTDPVPVSVLVSLRAAFRWFDRAYRLRAEVGYGPPPSVMNMIGQVL